MVVICKDDRVTLARGTVSTKVYQDVVAVPMLLVNVQWALSRLKLN